MPELFLRHICFLLQEKTKTSPVNASSGLTSQTDYHYVHVPEIATFY